MKNRVRAGLLTLVFVVMALFGSASTTVAAAKLTISKATATQVFSTSAVIEWSTNRKADSWVVVPNLSPVGNAKAVTKHSIALSNLTPGTTYTVSVRSADSTTTTSTNVTFTTPPGTLYVLRCDSCAKRAGHTAVLFHDGSSQSYTFMSWEADEASYNWKTGQGPARMRISTLTGTVESVFKSDKITYWRYYDYKAYALSNDQMTGLRAFIHNSEFTSANPPIYDFWYRNCAHFTWSAMLAAGLSPTYNYGDLGNKTPNGWFTKLSGKPLVLPK